MLDLSHPRSAAILAAARTEERIRAGLLGWLGGGETAGPAELLGRWLPDLHALNRAHFGADPGIARTLEALEDAVRRGDVHAARAGFLALAEGPGDNFGTWAI